MHFFVQDSVKLLLSAGLLLFILFYLFSPDVPFAATFRLCRRGDCVPVEHVCDHFDFRLCGSDLLCRGHFGGATEEERHFGE